MVRSVVVHSRRLASERRGHSMTFGIRRHVRLVLAGALLVTASCASSSAAVNPTLAAPSAINQAAIPLGDGHVSTSPKVGYVDSCQTFSPTGPGHNGPWI